MKACLVKNCKKDPKFSCDCGNFIFMCQDHVSHHTSDSIKFHSIKSTVEQGFLIEIKNHLKALSLKITNESIEAIKVIKFQTKADFETINTLEVLINNDCLANNFTTNDCLIKIIGQMRSKEVYHGPHFEWFEKEVIKLQQKIKKENKLINAIKKKIQIPYINNENSLKRTFTEEFKIPSIQFHREDDLIEEWQISSKHGLKRLPVYVVKQIKDGLSRGENRIFIQNDGRFCNFVDFQAKTYYWVDRNGTIKNNPERIFITRKSRMMGK